jgi:uncharacterized protein YndB with AHSA1/START domain
MQTAYLLLGKQQGEEVNVYFELSVAIARPPSDVFGFLRDKDLYPQQPGSPVLALEKTTPEPVGVGTKYREVVQMLPLVRGEMLSEITRYEPPRFLEEDFHGAGMRGHLAYEFAPDGDGTVLVQRETLEPSGLLSPFARLIERSLSVKLQERLESIRDDLESGWKVTEGG